MISNYRRYRIYEILPGLSVWVTLLGALVLSVLKPLWMIYFVIVFDVYWVLKALNYSFYLTLSWFRFRKVKLENWKERLMDEKKGLDLYHIIFITLYNEPWEVAEPSIAAMAEAVYDKEKFVVVIAGEGRQKENFENVYAKAQKKFGDKFFAIIGTLHPADPQTEVAGKASNLHYAEKQVDAFVEKNGWDKTKVVATIFDTDAICHEQYFAYLAYVYARTENPTRSSYQPVPFYNNNLWESNAVLRVMAFGTSFWKMVSLARQDSLHTFSSYSISWQALYDIGFHDKTVIGEDARLFYQCQLRYDGNYRVTPLYLPVYMDTVHDQNWWKSLKNLYTQQRRWAYGVEQIPYLLWNFHKKNTRMPFFKKLKWLFVEWESKWSWCCAVLLITILGRLPLWVAPESLRETTLYFNAPHILQVLMNSAVSALFVSVTLSLLLLPQKPKSYPAYSYIFIILQWILLPFSLIFMGSFPAIDAITRLMLGKYLGYAVAQKNRSSLQKG